MLKTLGSFATALCLFTFVGCEDGAETAPVTETPEAGSEIGEEGAMTEDAEGEGTIGAPVPVTED